MPVLYIQPPLFDLDVALTGKTEEAFDHAAWRRGYGAGFRRDELLWDLREYSRDFRDGYDVGMLDRQEAIRNAGKDSGQVA